MAPSGRELSAKLTEGECRTDSLNKPKLVLCSIILLAILPQSPPAAEPAPSRREPRALKKLAPPVLPGARAFYARCVPGYACNAPANMAMALFSFSSEAAKLRRISLRPQPGVQ